MKRFILFSFILSSFFVAPGFTSFEQVNVSIVNPQTESVYITKTGTKFHKSDCHFLRKSKIAIEKKEAKDRGYSACKVCKP